MATNRTRKTRSKRNKVNGLSEGDRQWLLHGWSIAGPWNRGMLMPEDMEQRLWEQHKDSLMETWHHPDAYTGSKFFAPRGPFTRPYAWWRYVSGLSEFEHPQNEKVWLRKHGHYTQVERLLEVASHDI